MSRFDFEPAIIDPDEEQENTWLLLTLGQRLHDAARRAGAVWPPPHHRPPPAAARDLLALYELAKQPPPQARELVGARLDRVLGFIHARVVDLIDDIEHKAAGARMLALETTTRSFGRPTERTWKSKAVQFATGAPAARPPSPRPSRPLPRA